MAKKEKEGQVETPKVPTLKYRVVSIADYLERARAYYGEANSWDNAVALIYTENKVVEVIGHKGESKFLVEA